jgi:hypothetical protein
MILKRKTLSRFFLLTLSVLILGSMIGSASSQEDTTETVGTINNSVFSPFFVDPVQFDVYDGNLFGSGTPDAFLGSVNTSYDGDLSTVFREQGTSTNYPRVEVIASEPFLVDDIGGQVLDEESAMVDLNNEIAITVEGDEIIYLRKFNFGVDIGMRTRTNLPQEDYYEHDISPLDNIRYAYGGRTDWDTFDFGGSSNQYFEPNQADDLQRAFNNGQYDINTRDGWEGSTVPSSYPDRVKTENDREPIGIILAQCDVGQTTSGYNWIVDWSPQRARIRNSLVDLSSYLDGLYAEGSSAEDSNYQEDVDKKLSSTFGNQKVAVVGNVRINLGGQFKYDYVHELDDGTILQVSSKSAELGFYNVKRSTVERRSGEIQNLFQQDIDTIVEQQISQAEAVGTRAATDLEDTAESDSIGWTTWNGISGRFQYLGQSPTINLTSAANSFGTLRSDLFADSGELYWKEIDVTEGLDLPETINLEVQSELQPTTGVQYASYQLDSQYRVWSGNIFEGIFDDRPQIHSLIKYPNYLTITNTYTIQRVVFSVAVRSVLQGAFINADGQPINITDWSDFDISSIGSLMDLSSFSVSQQSSQLDPFAFLADLFSQPWIWIVIIALVGVPIIIGIVYISRRGGGDDDVDVDITISPSGPSKVSKDSARIPRSLRNR